MTLNAVNFTPFMGIASNQISKLLGRDFSLGGVSIGLSYHTGLSVYLYDVKLDNPNIVGAKEAPKMVSVGKAQVSVALWKLMHGQISLINVSIDKGGINLINNGAGKASWDFPALTSSPEKTPQTEATKAENSPSIFDLVLPVVKLDKIKINYITPNATQTLNLDNFDLSKSQIVHNEIKSSMQLNDQTILLDGKVARLDQLFFNKGMGFSLDLLFGDKDRITLNGLVSLDHAFHIAARSATKISDPYVFMKKLGLEQPNLKQFKQLDLTIATSFGHGVLESETTHFDFVYRDKPYKLLLQAASQEKTTLFPLSVNLGLKGEQGQTFTIAGQMSEPLSDQKWLDVAVNSSLPVLNDALDAKEVELKDISLNAKISAESKDISIDNLDIKGIYQGLPLGIHAIASTSLDNMNNVPIQANISINYDHNEVDINSGLSWPFNKPNWMQTRMTGSVANLNSLLKGAGIILPYRIENIKIQANIEGVSDQKIQIKPDVNVMVNSAPIELYGEVNLNLANLHQLAQYNLVTTINGEDNTLKIKGMTGVPSETADWADVNIKTHFASAAIFDFLASTPEPSLGALKEINSDLNIDASNGKLNLNIADISTKYSGGELSLKGSASYGMYLANLPLSAGIFFSDSKSGDGVQLNANGFLGKDGGATAKLFMKVNNLSYYSDFAGTKLPSLENINLNSEMSLSLLGAAVDHLSLTAISNAQPMSLNLTADYNLKSTTFDLKDFILDINGVKANVLVNGLLEPGFNARAKLEVNATSLSGLNQFIYGWGYGVIPDIQDLKLALEVDVLKDHTDFTKITYQGSGTDFTAIGKMSKQQGIWNTFFKASSNVIDVSKIQAAYQSAKDNLKAHSNTLGFAEEATTKKKEEEVDPKKAAEMAEKAQKEKAVIPSWMTIPLGEIFEQYNIDAKLQLAKIIFDTSTITDVNLGVESAGNDLHVNFGAKNIFSGKVDGILAVTPGLAGQYHLQYKIYMGVLNLAQLVKGLHLEDIGLSTGQFMFDAVAHSEGQTTKELLDHLDGRIKVGMRDVNYRLVSSNNPITKFFSLLAGGGFSNDLSLNCGVFNAIAKEGRFDIQSGSMLNLSGSVVIFSGDVDLVNQKVDISLTPSAKFINLSSVIPPLTISGSFNNIYVYPNTMRTAVEVGFGAAIMATGVGAIGLIGYKLAQGATTAITNSCRTSLEPIPEVATTQSAVSNITSGALGTLGF